MIASLVGSHPGVISANEIPMPVLKSVLRTISAMDRSTRSWEDAAVAWEARRRDYLLNAIADTYAVQVSREGRRFLNKTPFIETRYREIRAICGDPLFIYCARHPELVLRSLMSMSWNRYPLPVRLHHLHRSAATLRRMQADPAIDVHVVRVDTVAPAERQAFGADLMAFLGLDMTPSVSAYIERWPLAQPSMKVNGRAARGFTATERAFLSTFPMFRRLCRQFGYSAGVTGLPSAIH